MITSSDIQAGVNAILTAYPDADAALVERGVMSLCEVMRFAGVGTKVAMLGVASRELWFADLGCQFSVLELNQVDGL